MSEAKRYPVLAVDDSKVSLMVISKALEAIDYLDIHGFSNPIEALEKINEIKPFIIISDFEMPEMDGIEFAQKVRIEPDYKNTPFILITGNTKIDNNSIALSSGVSRILQKPFQKHDLQEIVVNSLNIKEHKYSVLIVDDSSLYRKSLIRTINNLDLEIHEATSIAEAKATIENKKVDLIVLDNVLPDGRGAELCSELKQSEEHQHIVVIGLSSQEKSMTEFLSSGADDYMNKPYNQEEVNLRTEKELNRLDVNNQLKSLIEKEKAASFLYNKIMGIAAHDIRNPLATIKLALEILRESQTEEQKEWIDIIDRSVESGLNILEETLNMAKQKNQNERNKDYNTFDFLSLLKERILFFDQQAQNKNIKITLNFDSKNDAPHVNGNQTQISQVIDNLISNAIKYSHQDTEVVINLRSDVEGIVCSIKDQGVGIPEEELGSVFNAFQKTSSKPTEGESSTGLGLYVVHNAIEQHNGSIWAESKLNEGTTFTFTLPQTDIVEPSSPTQVSEANDNQVHAAKSDEASSTASKSDASTRILLVEDNLVNQKVVTKYFGKLGLDIDVAEDGEEALAKTNETIYDLILMDMNLPKMDGLTATREMRKNRDMANTPIVALTASQSDEDKNASEESGMNGFLTKPLKKLQILQMLNEFLGLEFSE